MKNQSNMEKNRMRLKSTVLAFSLATILLSGCSSTEEKSTAALTEGGQPVSTENAETSGYENGTGISSEPLALNPVDSKTLGNEFSDPANPLSKQTIYFSYDSSQVRQDFIPVIAAHTQYLLNHPEQRVVLEGHADERGSPEYNIALGEQRAKAVYRLMTVQGVASQQLEIISYGEEKPAVEGNDEASWQLNRRVEIIYQGQ